MSASVPAGASAAVLQPSEAVPDHTPYVRGPNFEKPFTVQSLLSDYERIGFQATGFGKAINIVNKMVGRFIV
jgi:deoxyhypusine synthase